MNRIERDGLSLCEIQAEAFERSVEEYGTSSEIFCRRFMNSEVAMEFDRLAILATGITPKTVLERLDEEYGISDYGSVKYTKNEMYWMGYIYRYFCVALKRSSKQVYKIIKPKELRGLFLAYHTLDPLQAVERILEAKGRSVDGMDINRQFEIYKRIREKSMK